MEMIQSDVKGGQLHLLHPPLQLPWSPSESQRDLRLGRWKVSAAR